MGNFTTVASIVTATRFPNRCWRNGINSSTGLRWQNFAQASGITLPERSYPAQVAAPGSAAGVTYDNTSAGALPLPTVTGGQKIYLSRARILSSGSRELPWTLILVDRLWSCSGLVANVITSQTIASVTLPARITDSGVDVEAWGTTWTAGGSTATVPSISYTNPSSTAGRTGVAFDTAAASIMGVSGGSFMFGLQSGDTGIKSIQSLTLSVSTGTAGNIGLVMCKRIATISSSRSPGLASSSDWMDLGMTQVDSATFIDAFFIANGTQSTPFIEIEFIVA